ncbi:HD domain-containing protein [Patescibacteria group bacterium]|nr:HD domain-containing protein [Patescibacteria group bacterium]MBU1683245.1 HD domain-containing protein [Patescibacteria group bacterium]MBU1934813.1 HD domain-containing protein [Patescibacteria group bacterium]
MNNKKLLNFIFELGQLRHIKREGWRIVNIANPESVADHALRAAQIGFFLAKMEKYENPYEVVTMVVFHDIGECRVGDINKVGNRYVDANEEKAVKDQLRPLDDRQELYELWKQTEHRSSIPGVIAKDADYLEQAIAAKEYLEVGYKLSADWIKNVKKHLQTKSGKILLKEMEKVKSTDWWQGLKKI